MGSKICEVVFEQNAYMYQGMEERRVGLRVGNRVAWFGYLPYNADEVIANEYSNMAEMLQGIAQKANDDG